MYTEYIERNEAMSQDVAVDSHGNFDDFEDSDDDDYSDEWFDDNIHLDFPVDLQTDQVEVQIENDHDQDDEDDMISHMDEESYAPRTYCFADDDSSADSIDLDDAYDSVVQSTLANNTIIPTAEHIMFSISDVSSISKALKVRVRKLHNSPLLVNQPRPVHTGELLHSGSTPLHRLDDDVDVDAGTHQDKPIRRIIGDGKYNDQKDSSKIGLATSNMPYSSSSSSSRSCNANAVKESNTVHNEQYHHQSLQQKAEYNQPLSSHSTSSSSCSSSSFSDTASITLYIRDHIILSVQSWVFVVLLVILLITIVLCNSYPLEIFISFCVLLVPSFLILALWYLNRMSVRLDTLCNSMIVGTSVCLFVGSVQHYMHTFSYIQHVFNSRFFK
jgi:hypothetical protein